MSIDWVYQGDARDVILKFSPNNGLDFFLVTQAGFSPVTPEYGHHVWVIPATVGSKAAPYSTVTSEGIVSVVNYQQQVIHGDVVVSIQPSGIAHPLGQPGEDAPFEMKRIGNVVTVTTPFPSSADFSAAVFDASGRVTPRTRVRSTLVNGVRSATWDAAGLPHGAYVLRLGSPEHQSNPPFVIPVTIQ
jgi:hypothetical protein